MYIHAHRYMYVAVFRKELCTCNASLGILKLKILYYWTLQFGLFSPGLVSQILASI